MVKVYPLEDQVAVGVERRSGDFFGVTEVTVAIAVDQQSKGVCSGTSWNGAGILVKL